MLMGAKRTKAHLAGVFCLFAHPIIRRESRRDTVYNRIRSWTLRRESRLFSRGAIHARFQTNEQTHIPETFVGCSSDSDLVSTFELGRG